MIRPQRHGGTEKFRISQWLCGSVAISLCVSVASASPNVHGGTLDVLHIKSRALNATRTVRIWLPPGFSRRAHYSVLYLNDGQNLFGDGDPESGGGGWRVDETAARLAAAHAIDPLIVVGIDNGGDRAREVDYLPDESGAADRYLTFVIEELMPLVDRKYPTLHGPAHTGFGGSSYGAANALYAVLSRPGVFGRLLLESPSVGVGGGVLLERARAQTAWPERIVMGIGSGEGRPPADADRGARPPAAFQTLVDILRAAGLGEDRLKVVVQEGGRHNEASWASRFEDAAAFLFAPSRPHPSHN
jgi:predicted alpha/beta superfamily hydrolase